MNKNKAIVVGSEIDDTVKLPTGFPSLDHVLGGGLIVGSIVELFGEESSGKTTLGLQILKKYQELGLDVLVVDAEHACVKEYISKFLDLDKMMYVRPASGEEAFDCIRNFLVENQDKHTAVLVDSIPALIPEKQVETGEGFYGPVANIMSKNLPSILRLYKKSVIIFINQVRTKITSGWGGNSLDTTGGWAIKFFAGHRLKLTPVKMILDENQSAIGREVRIDCEKNKFSHPFRTTTLSLLYGKGFSFERDVIMSAISLGIIKVSGAWYQFEDNKFHGKESLFNNVFSDDSLFEKILKNVLEAYSIYDIYMKGTEEVS